MDVLPAKRDRDGAFFGFTRSICPSCRKVIDAPVVIRGGQVLLQKKCPAHGHFEIKGTMATLRALFRPLTEHVLLESTRAFIEKLVSELVAEDMKDPEWRRWVRGVVERDYRVAGRSMGHGRRRARRRSG